MKNLKRYHQLFENTQDLTQEQKDWLDKCTKGTKGTWKVNPKTGLVDVKGNFDCSNLGLKDFKGVRFGSVSGDFSCSRNSLTSLEGAPQHVGRDFICSDNDLTSLEGLPDGFKVDGGFSCTGNELKSLEGAPQRVDGHFYCSYNDLTSLEDAPQHVGGDFSCGNNKLTSLEGAPQHVGELFNCSGNPISGKAIKGVLKEMRDKNIPLEGAVAEYWRNLSKDDRVYLAKHHTSLPEEEKRIYRAIELNMKRR